MTGGRLPRVVSLVPSLSETLSCLGADLVGVTRFCTRLPGIDADSVPRLGGTKNPDLEALRSLDPDLIVVNEEENRIEDVEALVESGFRVHVTFPRTVQEALVTIREVGEVAGVGPEASALVERLEDELDAARAGAGPEPSVFVPIWRHSRDLYMSVNSDTYAHDVVRCAGGRNVAAGMTERFPEVSLEEVARLGTDVALLGDEPYAFGERHVKEFADAGVEAVLCSGEDLHWYGPRSVEAVGRIRALLEGFGGVKSVQPGG